MIAFPSSTLAPHVAQRLLADWDRTHNELRALIAAREKAEPTGEEDLRLARLVRHIAILSTTLHGHHESGSFTLDERTWLEAQGVQPVH